MNRAENWNELVSDRNGAYIIGVDFGYDFLDCVIVTHSILFHGSFEFISCDMPAKRLTNKLLTYPYLPCN